MLKVLIYTVAIAIIAAVAIYVVIAVLYLLNAAVIGLVEFLPQRTRDRLPAWMRSGARWFS